MTDALSSGTYPLEVRYREAGRIYFDSTLPPLVRKQAKLTIMLGAVLGIVMVVLPFLALSLDDQRLTLGAVVPVALFAILPVTLITVGARRLNVTSELPQTVIEVTEDEVILAPLKSMLLYSRSRPERRLPRRDTRVEHLPGVGATKDRTKFMARIDGKKRTEYQATEFLDTPPEAIIAAIQKE